jgi:hypothetical protein
MRWPKIATMWRLPQSLQQLLQFFFFNSAHVRETRFIAWFSGWHSHCHFYHKRHMRYYDHHRKIMDSMDDNGQSS